MSVAGDVRKYNVAYGRFMAVCKSEDIPYPSSGYWTKKNMGKNVSDEIVALSGNEKLEITSKSVIIPISDSFEEKSEETKGEITSSDRTACW